VEPEDGMIVVAAAPVLGRTAVIAKVLVQEGQMVAPGQTIALLESLPDLESAVKQADARVAVAQSRLAQLAAGARAGDVLALKADLARLEVEAKAAKQAWDREEALASKDYVPRVQVDAARLKSQDAEGLVEAARHKLESLTEVRDSDLNLAKAGEAVGGGGVVTLADTNRMDVVAEVYETDIARVHPGQKAIITSQSFSNTIDGLVASISPQVESISTPVDASQSPDQRVYQARIRVKQPELLAHRIHSKVNVLIEP
jgi:HlyD family secretion protein